jgi:hypothetical protein
MTWIIVLSLLAFVVLTCCDLGAKPNTHYDADVKQLFHDAEQRYKEQQHLSQY